MNEQIAMPPRETQDAERRNDERVREEGRRKIAKLEARFTRMLLAIAAFIVLSIFAVGDFSAFPSLPEGIKKILGAPPSANMINTALIVYSFSAILLILSRMMGGYGNYGGMAHVGYLAAFYGFYHVSGGLRENLWAVFAAGMTILCLEAYHVWIYCVEQVKKERERLREMGIKDTPAEDR